MNCRTVREAGPAPHVHVDIGRRVRRPDVGQRGSTTGSPPLWRWLELRRGTDYGAHPRPRPREWMRYGLARAIVPPRPQGGLMTEFHDWDEIRAELHDGDDEALMVERARTEAWI